MASYDCSNYSSRTIDAILAFQANHSPDKIWLMSEERCVSFLESEQVTNQCARALQAKGLHEGDVVASMMPTSIETVLLCIAVVKAGGLFAAIDTDLKGIFLEERIAASHPKILVVDEECSGKLSQITLTNSAETALVCGSSKELFQQAALYPCKSLEARRRPENPMMVWWTSGTTGNPKGVVHTHSSVSFLSWQAASRFREDEVNYCCTPMYLGGAWLTSVFPTLIAGVTLAIDAKFSVSRYWDRIRYYGATSSLLLGAMHGYLQMAPPHELDKENPLRMAYCIPIDKEAADAFRDRFSVESVLQAYGMSETGPIFELDDRKPWNQHAVGLPVPHFEIQIVDENDQPLGRGQVGELCVRPNQACIVFKEYFDDSTATVEATRNLWFHCGDMLFEGEDGVFYFFGRKQDYVRHKGRNVSLFQIDSVANSHPNIFEAAAVGVPADDGDTEEEIALAVVLKEGAADTTPEDIAAYINDNAPYYMVPRFIVFLKCLPRSGHEKIVRHMLRDAFPWKAAWDSKQNDFLVTK